MKTKLLGIKPTVPFAISSLHVICCLVFQGFGKVDGYVAIGRESKGKEGVMGRSCGPGQSHHYRTW